LAVLILDESIGPSQFAGAACIFAGIVLVNRTGRPRTSSMQADNTR